jgi:hypothetical protein
VAARKKKEDAIPGPDDSEALEYPMPADGEFTLENMLTAEWGCNLATASNIQRAACRTMDGLPLRELAHDPDVVEAYGGELPRFEGVPNVVVLLWAIRAAKSMICACNAVTLSQKPILIDLKPGDSVRVPIVSTELQTAKATFSHLSGVMNSTPFLRSLIVKETADSVTVRHPTGRHIEICVVALSRAGSSLVGRWLPGVIFDESPRMASAAEFVKSLKESFDAVQGRIMPNGSIMMPGSPFKPIGLVFEMFEKYFGHPSQDCVVMKAIGPKTNRFWWTPERCEWLKRANPKLYRRDVLADFDDAEDSLFSYRSVESAMKRKPPEKRRSAFVATLYPASHRAAWTLIVLETFELNNLESHNVALALETEEIDMALLAKDLKPFKLNSVMVPVGTSWSMLEDAERAGMVFIPEDLESGDLLEQCRELQAVLDTGRMYLPEDKTLRGDLIRAQRVPTPDGKARVSFPEDEFGRRCDYAGLLARALKCATLPEAPAEPEEDDEARECRIMNERNGESAMVAAIRGVS